jgi:hypothetical protein
MLILTKYHPASNKRGERISAHAPGWDLPRAWVSYAYEKSGAECHANAVRALFKKAGLENERIVTRVESIPGGYAFMTETGYTLTINLEG